MNVVRSFVNYAIFRELCDRMRFEVDCAKSHHRVMHLSMLSRRGGRQGIGRGFDRHSWPVGRAFDRFSCPRGRII